MFNNVVEISHKIMSEVLKAGDTAVDATCGNGCDSLILSKLCGETGRVYAFDIQPGALANAKALLREESVYDNVEFIWDSHDQIAKYVKKNIDACVFNLGYLPRADKSVVTKADTTLKALKLAFELLKPKGHIIICLYLGHEGGRREYEAITAYINSLDPKTCNAVLMSYLIRRDDAPRLIVLEKIR